MALFNRNRPGTDVELAEAGQLAEVRAELDRERATAELLEESLAQLELAMDDVGWLRMSATADQEFSRDGVRRIAAISKLMWMANPLIRRGVNVAGTYVWGQGVEVAGRDDTVNDVVQDFLADAGNQAELFGHQASIEKDRDLRLDGNVFLVCFTHPITGRVQVRSIPADEIDDKVTNPEDRTDPWFYKRVWIEHRLNPDTGMRESVQKVAWYPALGHRPRPLRSTVGGHPVMWDAPLLHARVGGLSTMRFGVPEVYPALAWARAYKEFLEDWASIVKSLNRFAWQMKTKGSKVARVARSLETARTDDSTGERKPAGATAVFTPDADLTPIPKTGATVDAESGRPLAMMVAAALDVPVTVLLADPGLTGARAVAETLDRPTELAHESRRTLWADVIRTLCGYAIAQSVKAPRGALRGVVGRDEYGRETIDIAGVDDDTVVVTWPTIVEHDIAAQVEAIAKAASTGVMPPEQTLRLLLVALGVEDIDDIVEGAMQDLEDAKDEQAAEEALLARVTEALLGLRDGLKEAS